MSTSPTSTNLQQALAEYRAALSPYPSSSEKATSAIIVALADELAALQPGAGTTPTANPQPNLQGLHSVIAGLSQQVAALQRDLNELKAAREEDRSAKNPDGEIQALRREVASLRQQISGGPRQPQRRAAPLPGSLAPMRPVEELLDDAPQLDDTISEAQMQAYIDRPRVRPEDIQLTEGERKQLRRPVRSPIKPSDAISEKSRSQSLPRSSQRSTSASNPLVIMMFMAVIVILLLMVLL